MESSIVNYQLLINKSNLPMKYLNPRADLTFKKVFGEHPDLVMSFLNALLPFERPEDEIKSVEYLNPELVPLNPFRKDSIVDVRCKDQMGRQFIVEMQMMWTPDYKQRVLFNASKAYVSQLEQGNGFELLQPVYSLNLLNDTFSKDSEHYYHDYRIVESQETKEIIEGMRFIFVELPKFTPKNYSDKKMMVLWLRYLTEIDEKTREVPRELLENPDIRKAVTQLEESAFTKSQLAAYDKFWDVVRNLKSIYRYASQLAKEKIRAEGLAKGREEGRAEGLAKGREEGREEERLMLARGMKAKGLPPELIAEITGLPLKAIEAL